MFNNYFFIKNKYQNLNRTAVITEKKLQISYQTWLRIKNIIF